MTNDLLFRRCARILGKKVYALHPTSVPNIYECIVAGGVSLFVDAASRKVLTSFSKKRSGFYIYDHQKKSAPYRNALLKHGFRPQAAPQEAEIILTDMDAGNRSKRLFDVNSTALKFLYPHTARPAIWRDGLAVVHPGLTAAFVATETHAEIMRRVGYQIPIHAVGFGFCDLLPFQPCPEPRRILFMPIHPNANGYLTGHQKDLNRRVYEILRRLHHEKRIELTVRHLCALEQNGLYVDAKINFVRGLPDQSTQEIDRADAVVATHTAAYMSVARGKPTAMIAEDEIPLSGNSDDVIRFVEHWRDYRDLMIYPFDILDGDPLEVLRRAGTEWAVVMEWRERMIGEPFDAGKFIDFIQIHRETGGLDKKDGIS